MQNLRRLLPFLSWPRPGLGLLRGETAAAVTVAAVMVPQSVAYAQLAGMPLVTGLYAAFLPALAAVLFSHSTRLSVGPSALTCVLIGAALVGLAEPGTPRWVMLAVWLALLSAAVQIAVGALRSAWLLNLVSSPVLTGFTQAAAVLIIASQLPGLLGLKGPLSSLINPGAIHFEALAYGLTSLLLFEAGRRLLPRLPVVLLVLAAAAMLSAWTGYAQRGAVVGTLPAGLPAFYLPGWPGWETLQALIAPALVIALISSLEMAASAKIESQREGRRWDADQDLIGQGLAKLAAAFSGAFPTSTSFSRSAISLYAGARTSWSTVITALLVLAVLLAGTATLYHVPIAVLSAVVVTAVAGLIRPRAFALLWRIGRAETVTAGVTFAVTVASTPRIYWGVLTGVLMGLAHFLYLRLHPRIIEVGLHPDGSLRDRRIWELPRIAADVCALRLDAALDFASASVLERDLMELLAAQPGARHVCLFAQPINRVDATGVEVFAQVRNYLHARGIALHVSGMKLPVEQVMRRAGALTEGPLLHLYRTDTEALQALARNATTEPPPHADAPDHARPAQQA